MRISDWVSGVCSSDLGWPIQARSARETGSLARPAAPSDRQGILRALDRHGDRAPGDKIDPCRNLVDRNANGDTLGEADPTEGGVDIGEKAPRNRGPLAVVYTGGAALDMPREGLVLAHHANRDRCARMAVGDRKRTRLNSS